MLHIVGMGSFHPRTQIDNKFIEDLNIGTNSEWILDKIGIHIRVSTLPLDYIRETRNQNPKEARSLASHTPTELGALAAEKALKSAGISSSQIGLVICNTCTPNENFSSEAQRIANALDITAPTYDVLTACPAFALHMDYLNNFREETLPDYVLCISTAAMTQKVNYNDRSDAAIWGDGAAAWIVSAKHEGKLALLDSTYGTDASRCEAVVVDTFGFFHQDGRAVRDFSVRHTVRLIKAMEAKHEINWERDVFVGHQANATMLRQVTENRGIPEKSHWHNVTFLGNQAAAGAPASLALHWDEIKKGQKVVVAVVGAGLSWGSLLFEGR